jgi:glycosyltransferase involved in cell wall biosynthesis
MTPTVTIVIPTRERPDYLRASLHSVLASAAEAALIGIETRVLVVDDASPTDSTRRLAAELGVACHRIETHDGRNNPASAIARGVSLVETEYLSVFGDDDIMLPRFIAAHVEALETGYDVCTTAFLHTDARLRTTREVILPEPALGDLLAGRITINDGAMTRSRLVRELPWDPTLDQVIFYPIWLELLFTGARFTRLTEPTFLYRRHSDNVSDRLDTHDAELRAAIRERYAARVLARDGAIPPPSVPARGPGPPPAPRPPSATARGRTFVRRAKAALGMSRTG